MSRFGRITFDYERNKSTLNKGGIIIQSLSFHQCSPRNNSCLQEELSELPVFDTHLASV